MAGIGVYIHIPFCAQKCRYCDFYSVGYDRELAARYIDAVINQLSIFCESGERREADAVYFGGGTPSLLEERDAARVVDAVSRRMGLSADCEITLELNPETATPKKLKNLKSAGINRLSIGIQTIDPNTLKVLGRRHSAEQAKRAVAMADEAGFENISADIMLALPGENKKTLTKTLDDITGLPVKHISAYMLKIASDTPFFENPPKNIPDDEQQSELYEYCCEYLKEKNFMQYEISNFAKPGFESRHNMKYWSCDDYIGLGAAAHSSIAGKRYSFSRDINRFIETYSEKTKHKNFTSALNFEGDVTAEDYIMLRLRTTKGLDVNVLYKRYNLTFSDSKKKLIAKYAESGFLEETENGIALTVKGMLVSNTIISSLIY